MNTIHSFTEQRVLGTYHAPGVVGVLRFQYGSHKPRVAIHIELKLNRKKNSILQVHKPHFTCSSATWGYWLPH